MSQLTQLTQKIKLLEKIMVKIKKIDQKLVFNLVNQFHPTLSQKSPAQIKTILNHFPKFWNQQWILSKLNFTTPIAYLHQHAPKFILGKF